MSDPAAITVTVESLAIAFMDWETARRADPDGFLDAAEAAYISPKEFAQNSAEHFFKLLAEHQTKGAA